MKSYGDLSILRCTVAFIGLSVLFYQYLFYRMVTLQG